ncbi:hypothetical protein RRG08_028946 [Elysia crispata]|uniref:Uncharacterized protein n=1 Tax=Elysia crispata TaxID=231223 RepID=A0AAE1AQ09_9GAST|nr:hypothetical protein RRG08_028946 [Elysia crispata]
MTDGSSDSSLLCVNPAQTTVKSLQTIQGRKYIATKIEHPAAGNQLIARAAIRVLSSPTNYFVFMASGVMRNWPGLDPATVSRARG